MRKVIWVTLAVLVLGYGVFALATLDRRADDEQIRSLFVQAADAVAKRDTGGALSLVSADYKDASGLNYDRLRLLTAQALHSEQKFTVDYKLANITISGDTATAGVDLTVNGGDPGRTIYKRLLTVTLHKENIRHALIIPTKVWHVTSIENLGLSPEEGI